MQLPGTPSDEVADVLATGRGDITTVFVSMATRHPEGTDADYLRWHTLDHRPEQHRLSAVRASLRLVSTPQCRAARAVSDGRFDAVDHVMTYFFTDVGGMDGFLTLSNALGAAGRKLPLLPHVERGVYGVRNKVAAPRAKVGADVLPWWPVRGVLSAAGTAGAVSGGPGRARRCRRGLVDDGARRRPAAGLCPGGPTAHLLLPRRRPGRHCRAVATRPREALGDHGHRTAVRCTVSSGDPPRMGPLCALRRGPDAPGLDDRLRQGACARRPTGRVIEDATSAEAAGFTSFWIPQVPGLSRRDDRGGARRSGHQRIELGTAIVPLQTRHPIASRAAGPDDARGMRGRFAVGVGPSHHWIIGDQLGLPYDRPAHLVRDYLEVLNAAFAPGAVDVENDSYRVHSPMDVSDPGSPPILLAALGPTMLRIAGEHASRHHPLDGRRTRRRPIMWCRASRPRRTPRAARRLVWWLAFPSRYARRTRSTRRALRERGAGARRLLAELRSAARTRRRRGRRRHHGRR